MKALAFSLVLIGAPALAQTQADMNRAADSAWRKEDAAMTRQWRETYAYLKRLDAQDTSRGGGIGYAAAALESQRAWLKFRDAQCVLEGSKFAGGSLQPMIRLRCMARMTGERRLQLRGSMWR